MRILISLIVFAFSLSAFGAEKQKKVQYRKTQEVNFDATDVDGQIRSPDGSYLHQKKGIKFLPIYKVQKQFDKDIKDSVDYLR